MDSIRVELRRQANVGAFAKERRKKQPIEVSVTAFKNLRGVGEDLKKTIDYTKIYDAVEKIIAGEEHVLVEGLAERIADVVKKLGAVRVVVRLHKPRAFPKAWVEIER